MKTGKQKAKKKERERKREKIKIHHERETLESREKNNKGDLYLAKTSPKKQETDTYFS